MTFTILGLFITLLVIVLTIVIYSYSLVKEKLTGSIKRPPGLPIIGHAKYFTPSINLQTLKDFCHKYGPVYEIFLFSKRFLVFTDYQNIQEIASKRPKYFRRDINIVSAFKELNLVPNGLFVAEGQVWSRMRRILSTPFNKPNSDAMSPHIFLEVKSLINQLKNSFMKPINLNHQMVQFSLQVIMRVAMGNIPLNEYITGGEYVKDVVTLFDFIITRSICSDFMWKYFCPSPSLRKRSFEANNRLEKLVHFVIQNKKNSLNSIGNKDIRNKKTLIDVLINDQLITSTNDQTYSKLSDDEIVSSIKTIILAGSETTSSSLAWTLYFLSQNRKHFECLRKEADEKLIDINKVTNYETRIDLPFASACFKEAIRIYGPGPFMGCSKLFLYYAHSLISNKLSHKYYHYMFQIL